MGIICITLKHTTMKKKFTGMLLLAAIVATLTATGCSEMKKLPHPPHPPKPGSR